MSLTVAGLCTAVRCLATWVAGPTKQTAEILAASFGPLFVGWVCDGLVCDCSSTVNDGEAAVHTKFGYLITELSGFALAAYSGSVFSETEKKVFFGLLASVQFINVIKEGSFSFFSPDGAAGGDGQHDDGRDEVDYLELEDGLQVL